VEYYWGANDADISFKVTKRDELNVWTGIGFSKGREMKSGIDATIGYSFYNESKNSHVKFVYFGG